MQTIRAAICQPDQPPPPGARLVAFSGADPSTIRSRDRQAFLAQAAAYAAHHQVYLAPGMYVSGAHLCLSLIDDHGQVMLEQPATHLNPSWAGDLQRGEQLHIAHTPFGAVALFVDVDIYKSELGRIAALLGAEIGVSQQWLRADHARREMVLAGAWQQAQQNCLFILNAGNRHAAILGPCETAPDCSGFLAEAPGAGPLAADLSASRRAAAYRSFPVFKSLNPPLYRRHMDELCR